MSIYRKKTCSIYLFQILNLCAINEWSWSCQRLTYMCIFFFYLAVLQYRETGNTGREMEWRHATKVPGVVTCFINPKAPGHLQVFLNPVNPVFYTRIVIEYTMLVIWVKAEGCFEIFLQTMYWLSIIFYDPLEVCGGVFIRSALCLHFLFPSYSAVVGMFLGCNYWALGV